MTASRRTEPQLAPNTGSASDFIPDDASLGSMAKAAQECRGCELYARATQAVFGEGRTTSQLVLVGEQPGDVEDREGRPFVGPAGRVLDPALEEAEIDRRLAYVTNAVKHFNWEERGKRRIHKKPSARQMAACRPWLDHEIALIQPRIVVALGAVAAQSMFGRDFRLLANRGRVFESSLAPHTMATVHPSSILRAPDDEAREVAMHDLVADLRKVAPLLDGARPERVGAGRRG
jgi:DNA polymerase